MREDLLGLELNDALGLLREEGVEPCVTITAAPKRTQSQDGVLRVICASGDGSQLTAARFFDPIASRGQENA